MEDTDVCICGHVRDEHEQFRDRRHPASDCCLIEDCECLGFEGVEEE